MPTSTPADGAGSAAPADNDDALMQAYAERGDLPAFEALYARHRAGLYRFVRRLLHDQGSALTDEVYQDTWLRVVNARESWKPQGASFRTWLYTLAQHRAIDVLRRSGREVSWHDGDDDSAPFEPAGKPWAAWPSLQADAQTAAQTQGASQDDQLFWRRAGVKLLECLGELPMPQKAVFLMHHDDDEPVERIADALGIGFETAKSRLRYAMTKLRRCMGAYLDPLQSLGGER